MKPSEGRNRVVIEEVSPMIDGGARPVCRIVGDVIHMTAAIFADGHDHLAARLNYRHTSERKWRSAPMVFVNNDLWEGFFRVDRLGEWIFTLEAWIDPASTPWASDLRKRLAAQPIPAQNGQNASAVAQDIPLALRSGALLIRAASKRASGADARKLEKFAASIEALAREERPHYEDPLTDEIVSLTARYPDLTLATRYEKELAVRVESIGNLGALLRMV